MSVSVQIILPFLMFSNYALCHRIYSYLKSWLILKFDDRDEIHRERPAVDSSVKLHLQSDTPLLYPF